MKEGGRIGLAVGMDMGWQRRKIGRGGGTFALSHPPAFLMLARSAAALQHSKASTDSSLAHDGCDSMDGNPATEASPLLGQGLAS